MGFQLSDNSERQCVLCVPYIEVLMLYSMDLFWNFKQRTEHKFCSCFTAQVDRKIKSLRGHYNTVKRLIKSGSTTGSAGLKKPLWPHYDRLLSFLGSTEYDPQENNIIMQPMSISFVTDIISGSWNSLLVQHQTRDQKVASSNPRRSGRRIFFFKINFVC